MRIAMVGAGGIGGYFGGRLAHAGEEVIFVARGEQLRAIQANGLRVEDVTDDIRVTPALATDDPSQVGPVDAVVLAVKGWQAPEAIAAMRPMVGDETMVVPLLNGVDTVDLLIEAFGKEHVLGGLCRLLGYVVAPGHIRNQMATPAIEIGELDNKKTERIERLRAALARSGARVTLAPDILAAMWEKLLFVGPVGAVGAVTRSPMGVFRSIAETRALLAGSMEEIFTLAHARGVAVMEGAVAKGLIWLDSFQPEATSSMQRDILAGKPSELESQVGVIVRLAHTAGVAVPCHDMLYAALLPQERQARGEVAFLS